MNKNFEKVAKKYSLNNSYFKNKDESYPDTMLEIAQYWKQFGELPFVYPGDDWVYDTMIERQRKRGVLGSQYLSTNKTAEQIAVLAENFNPANLEVLDACCGTGQLTKALLEKGFNVEGFDGDGEMVELCKIIYPESNFFRMDFREAVSERRWELIVANPPHEHKYLPQFFEWLSTALATNGKAILLLPTDYMVKKHQASVVKLFARFKSLYTGEVCEEPHFSKCKSQVYFLELSEEFKNSLEMNKSIDEMKAEEIQQPQLKDMEPDENEKIYLVPLASIKPNPENHRKNIREEEIQELALSIKKSGLLQSITLRPKADYYEIVCGERRCLAFIKNGEEKIPAYIKELSDIQVMEMCLAENLLRKNLSPMEESNAFQKFILTGNYAIENLATTFGKTDSYIKSRLRLQHLTDDFKTLLDNMDISLSSSLEISKYDLKSQENIFKEHFLNDDTSNWRDLGVKELARRIESTYTSDLSKYKFDKKECASCQFNTGTYSLFTNAENGRCTNSECLRHKRTDFTLGFCKVVAEKYEDVEVCIAPYDKLDDRMSEKLEEQGIKIITSIAKDFPEEPQKPIMEEFNSEEEFKIALDNHKIEVLDYNQQMDEIQEKVDLGELKKVVYIGNNNPKLGYIAVNNDMVRDPLKTLDQEDAENKKQAALGVIKDLSQLIQTCMLPISGFSAFEEQALLFLMLDSLSIKNYALFGIEDTNQKFLTDDMKYKLSKTLTDQLKIIIQRDFIIKHLVKSVDSNSKSLLLIEFSRLHFPQETNDISRKYTDSYNVKFQKIKKQKEKIINKIDTVKESDIST
ncbi:ParB/RepB/Spo0J family partition protein [Dysgonomonas hofstadii]|uniref:ParB/RepB/Spo0J family partition protein n=1 Tax=Dysgonomonas hofstadii TaxID=637886 RepID=A0A840CS83_9BACT|nr:ParB/RepB/Spo0J family partition protein [Dysgonomonas hofstadii]MBB4035392.1 ParB/RepB/Spo0J family partition protein [Dysgonomonas hofstadii]